MEKLKYIKAKDIKFDENNVYFAAESMIYERIEQGLTSEEAGMYLVFVMSLEISLEEGYILEDDRPIGFFDVRELENIYTNVDVEVILNKLINKGYIEEIIIDDYKGYLFLY